MLSPTSGIFPSLWARNPERVAALEASKRTPRSSPISRSGKRPAASVPQPAEKARTSARKESKGPSAPALMIDKRIRQLPHVSFAGDTYGDLISRTWQFMSGSSSIYVTSLIASGAGAIIISIFQFAGFFVQLRVHLILAVLSALTVAYFLIINGPVGSPKYRLPIEPILIIWFGCALLSLRKKIKKCVYLRTRSWLSKNQ